MYKITESIISQQHTLGEALNLIAQALKLRSNTKEIRGELGELAVIYTLLNLQSQFPNCTKLYNNILLPYGKKGKTTEIDLIFVTPYAIFVIEVKSFYGNTTINLDNSFTVTSEHGIRDYYPIKQNISHCGILNNYLQGNIASENYIKPIVTLFSIGNTKDLRSGELRNLYPVLNVKYLYNHIYKCLTIGLTNKISPKVDVLSCCRIIENHNIYSKETMIQHINRLKMGR